MLHAVRRVWQELQGCSLSTIHQGLRATHRQDFVGLTMQCQDWAFQMFDLVRASRLSRERHDSDDGSQMPAQVGRFDHHCRSHRPPDEEQGPQLLLDQPIDASHHVFSRLLLVIAGWPVCKLHHCESSLWQSRGQLVVQTTWAFHALVAAGTTQHSAATAAIATPARHTQLWRPEHGDAQLPERTIARQVQVVLRDIRRQTHRQELRPRRVLDLLLVPAAACARAWPRSRRRSRGQQRVGAAAAVFGEGRQGRERGAW
mmetsp:Transcript_163129/g.523110  ORF Transcript_163129/g.523110 Transcript_163129/m.523110 type:complete len:258 (-) Transcript_163129:397-1170(-)